MPGILGYVTMLRESLKNMIKRSVKGSTVLFPTEHVSLPPGFRGVPQVIEDKCILCRSCERICPSHTIQIHKTDTAKTFKFTINLAQCLFCGMCQYHCREDAIHLLDYGSETWLLADLTMDSMQRSWTIVKEGKGSLEE
ncbi:MAG: 4Fe-4S binding protein [Candidatus Hodarchaeota archaeon]